MKYISSRLYRKMIGQARAEGLSNANLATFAIPDEQLQTLEAVPAEQFFELHEKLDELRPGFAVRVGQEMKIEDYGVLGLSWRTCSRVREIYERSERYFMLLSNTYLFKVNNRGSLSDVLLLREPHRKGVALSNEATLSASVVVLRAMSDSDISPVSVSFKHAAPADTQSHQAAFQCPVHFEQDHYMLTYRKEDLDRRTAKADQSINAFLLARVAEETEGLSVSSSQVVHDVEVLVRDALPSGIPAIGELAQHMGMSNRTLTRRLSEQGIQFRELVQRVQQEVARELLSTTANSVAEVAFQTGFSEQSAFSRAFKRWTGASPAAYRKAF
jgi:AraC-like DNA-binding protein